MPESIKLEGVLIYHNRLVFDFVIAKLFKEGYFDPSSQSILAYGDRVGAVFDNVIVFSYATYPASLYTRLICDQLLFDSTCWLIMIDEHNGAFVSNEQCIRIRFGVDKDWYKPILRRAEIPELVRPSYDLTVRLLPIWYLQQAWLNSSEYIQQQDELTDQDAQVLQHICHQRYYNALEDTLKTEYFRCWIHAKYRETIKPTEKWLIEAAAQGRGSLL